MSGHFQLAEQLLDQANETIHQLGTLHSSVSHIEALVRLLAGEPARAERTLRAGVLALASMTDRGLLATTTAMLAEAVYAQGRLREADELCQAAANAGAPDDIVTQVIWRSVKAKILARENRREEAEPLARAAVALVAPTDLLSFHGDAMLDLAEVLRASGRSGDAERAVRSALSLYETKGNTPGAARARSLLSNGGGET
jgi:ATP/maltotriose-dependent transcriptional regulator MalT